MHHDRSQTKHNSSSPNTQILKCEEADITDIAACCVYTYPCRCRHGRTAVNRAGTSVTSAATSYPTVTTTQTFPNGQQPAILTNDAMPVARDRRHGPLQETRRERGHTPPTHRHPPKTPCCEDSTETSSNSASRATGRAQKTTTRPLGRINAPRTNPRRDPGQRACVTTTFDKHHRRQDAQATSRHQNATKRDSSAAQSGRTNQTQPNAPQMKTNNTDTPPLGVRRRPYTPPSVVG